MSDLFDYAAAVRLRDEGMARVSAKDVTWMDRAIGMIGLLEIGREMTGEEIRVQLHEWGLEKPHSPNAWGALMNAAIRRGHLTMVGIGRMKIPKSHARMTPIYRAGGK